jgi:hypothetical protein
MTSEQPFAMATPNDLRKIFTRTIRSVTWLPEEERLELRLVLPQPDEEAAAAGTRVDSVRARGGTRTPTVTVASGGIWCTSVPVARGFGGGRRAVHVIW